MLLPPGLFRGIVPVRFTMKDKGCYTDELMLVQRKKGFHHVAEDFVQCMVITEGFYSTPARKVYIMTL